MKAKLPMLLPWLARKAGIGDHRAEQLWRAALRHADACAAFESPEYWGSAMDRLLELIAAEKLHQDAFGWRRLAREGLAWWQMPVAFFDGGSLLARRAWLALPEQQHRWRRVWVAKA